MTAPAGPQLPLNLNFRGELQRNEGQRPHFNSLGKDVKNFSPNFNKLLS